MGKFLVCVTVVLAATSAFGYTGATVSVVDVAPTDVPGPQPITVFPVPAAVSMPGAHLIYDNAALLDFSTSNATLADRNFVTMPLTAPNITINNVTYQGQWSAGGFKVTGINNALAPQAGLYTNTQDVPLDNRFPADIPRPGRYAGYDYTAVQFDFDQDMESFGVYVAMNSNQWQPTWGIADDNNIMTTEYRQFWVAVLGPNDTFDTAQYVQVPAANMYAPFIHVAGNGTDLIASVCVVQDSSVEAGAPFGFFDAYVTIPADANDDGHVNVIDLLMLSKTFTLSVGHPGYDARCDFNGDNTVNVIDLLMLAKYFARY